MFFSCSVEDGPSTVSANHILLVIIFHSKAQCDDYRRKQKQKPKACTSENMWPWGLSGGCDRWLFRLLLGQQNRPDIMTRIMIKKQSPKMLLVPTPFCHLCNGWLAFFCCFFLLGYYPLKTKNSPQIDRRSFSPQ